MKKITFLRNFGIAALFAILALLFIGCTNPNVPNQNPNPTPEVEADPVYKVVFDPAATDTYEIRNIIVDKDGNFVEDADGNETYDVLVKDKDYEIDADGNLIITPKSWYTIVVLKEEVDATGAEVTLATVSVDVEGKEKMGFSLISSAKKENYSGEIAVASSTNAKEYKGTFGKKYTGTDWSTKPETHYKGAEKVIMIQLYVLGGADDGWNATSYVKVTLSKIVVYNVAGLEKHNKEAGAPEPVVSDVLDEIKLTAQSTETWSGKSTESVEIKKDTTSVVLEITDLNLTVSKEVASEEDPEKMVVARYLNLYEKNNLLSIPIKNVVL